MPHTLTFQNIYKSIVSLPDAILPEFVVLTGRNGSGKTHLLEAISETSIRSSIVTDKNTDVRLFDWSTLIPTDTGVYDPAQDQTNRSQWFTTIRRERERSLSQLQQFAVQLGIPAGECLSIQQIVGLSPEQIKEYVPDNSNASKVHEQIQQKIKELGTHIYNRTNGNIRTEHFRKASPRLSQSRPELFLTASESQFFETEELLWGDVDPFQQAFGRIFTTHRELVHANDRLEKYPPENEPERRHLSQEEFIEQHGPPPWDFVNQILSVCQLDFRVDRPLMHEIVSYEPKLHKQSRHVEMRFQDLSSGEKVLMSFALCLYNSQEKRQEKVFPKLLLLDEVDADLAPSTESTA